MFLLIFNFSYIYSGAIKVSVMITDEHDVQIKWKSEQPSSIHVLTQPYSSYIPKQWWWSFFYPPTVRHHLTPKCYKGRNIFMHNLFRYHIIILYHKIFFYERTFYICIISWKVKGFVECFGGEMFRGWRKNSFFTMM